MNENNFWIYKKVNVVDKFDYSFLFEKVIYEENLDKFYINNGLSWCDYVIVGGGFLIGFESIGIIGSLIVFGLIDMEDYDFVY